MADGTDNQLVTIERADALAVFTNTEKVDPILAQVRARLDAFTPDVSTKHGRDAIASIAYSVARSKTYLDGVGKELADEQKEIPRKIDASRKRIRDTLDAWKDEVRAPLTAWEAEEKARVDRIHAALAELQAVIDDKQLRSAVVLRDRLAEVKAEAITDERFGDAITTAVTLKDRAIAALQAQIADAEKREAEAAELARLRAAEAERERIEREAKAAQESAERERKAAEAAAQAERAKAEAAAKAAQEAVLREQADKARREADREHCATINRAALAAFVDGGIAEDVAKIAVTLIAAGAIPNVTINY